MSHRKIVSIDLMGHLCLIPDPRQRKVKHPLINILFIGVVASLCGVDDFVGLKTNLTRKAVGARFFSVFNRISGKNQGPPDY